MPKRAHKKATSFDWTQKLDAEAVEAAMEEATVDANGEDEQHSELLTVIGEELQFPFSAQVLGETVTIVDMEWPEHDGFGLDLIVERSGKRHRMEARSVELFEPLPAWAFVSRRVSGVEKICVKTRQLQPHFPEPLPGPIAIGYASHFGLGLLAASELP